MPLPQAVAWVVWRASRHNISRNVVIKKFLRALFYFVASFCSWIEIFQYLSLNTLVWHPTIHRKIKLLSFCCLQNFVLFQAVAKENTKITIAQEQCRIETRVSSSNTTSECVKLKSNCQCLHHKLSYEQLIDFGIFVISHLDTLWKWFHDSVLSVTIWM